MSINLFIEKLIIKEKSGWGDRGKVSINLAKKRKKVLICIKSSNHPIRPLSTTV